MNTQDARDIAYWAIMLDRANRGQPAPWAAGLTCELHTRSRRYKNYAEAQANGRTTRRQDRLDLNNDERLREILALVGAKLDTSGGVWPRALWPDGRSEALP